jgi:HlyD family secretion protein
VTLKGSVTRVYPEGFTKISSLGVEQQRVNVVIRPHERPDELGVGYRVYVRITLDEAADALTVPRTALFRNERGQWNVMVVRDGRTEVRSVSVGLLNDESAQITSGLEGEDAVVTVPSREIEENQRVRVAELGSGR